MESILAIAALVAAACACVVAVRSTAAARRLALEMIQLRDRLARAERQYRDPERDEEGAPRDVASAQDAALLARLAELDGRLRDALVEPVHAGGSHLEAPDADEGREHIRRHLRREGFERVAFLGETDAGAWLIEAEREGLVSKGRAEAGGDGTVHFEAQSSVRAFP